LKFCFPLDVAQHRRCSPSGLIGRCNFFLLGFYLQLRIINLQNVCCWYITSCRINWAASSWLRTLLSLVLQQVARFLFLPAPDLCMYCISIYVYELQLLWDDVHTKRIKIRISDPGCRIRCNVAMCVLDLCCFSSVFTGFVIGLSELINCGSQAATASVLK
jgi:hypothetical protein